jgi:micrococcal nuclease
MKIKGLIVFFLVIILLSIIAIYYPSTTSRAISIKENYAPEEAKLLRVIDGDTIEVLSKNNTKQSIRLLGINTPEKGMPFSDEAASFLRKFVNKTIVLERDKEDTDKYKRKLRYIFYNSSFLNLEIVENGFANIYYTRGLKYENKFISAEKQARNLEIGFWKTSQEKCSTNNCLSLKELNYTAEYFIIKNKCNYVCELEGWFVKDAGRNVIYLSSMNSGEEKTYNSGTGKDLWNNNGDKFFLLDKKGFIVLFFEY